MSHRLASILAGCVPIAIDLAFTRVTEDKLDCSKSSSIFLTAFGAQPGRPRAVSSHGLNGTSSALLKAMRNALTFDIEDYFHTEAMSGVAPRQSWNQMALRVEINTHRLFRLLERHEIRATMFFLGWVAERCPGLVAEAVARGHEIGCHSYWHSPVYRLSPHEFREDTKRAKDVIESAASQVICGYRAPSFSIIHGMNWATDILTELGFTYDSSCNPINHDLYNNPNAPRQPHHAPSGLLEIPISTWRVGKINLPVGGGAYLRVLPTMYMSLGLRRLVAAGERLVLYSHPWEIDPGQPRLAAPVKSRLRQYLGLTHMEYRLEQIMAAYAFGPIEEVFASDIQNGLPHMDTLASNSPFLPILSNPRKTHGEPLEQNRC